MTSYTIFMTSFCVMYSIIHCIFVLEKSFSWNNFTKKQKSKKHFSTSIIWQFRENYAAKCFVFHSNVSHVSWGSSLTCFIPMFHLYAPMKTLKMPSIQSLFLRDMSFISIGFGNTSSAFQRLSSMALACVFKFFICFLT